VVSLHRPCDIFSRQLVGGGGITPDGTYDIRSASKRPVLRLNHARTETLIIATVAALSAPIVIGMANSQSAPTFEIASVKPSDGCEDHPSGVRFGIRTSPGRLSIECQTVDFLIRQAYLANGRDYILVSTRLFGQPIKGSPAWLGSSHYAIDAKTQAPESRETMLGPMMQALLEERFKLKTHREVREVPLYELRVGKGGAKLQAASEQSCSPFDPEKIDPPPGTHSCGMFVRSLRPGTVPAALYGATLADLARGLSRLLDRDVLDKTNIAGVFDIRLDLSVTDLFPHHDVARSDPGVPDTATDPQGSSIFTAMQKLGLKLETARGQSEFLVIDHVERPSGN
jgi:uncharacterized protein (TIGR03435 family)